MSNGLHETILHHWSAFEKKYPNANKYYWKPLPTRDDTFPGSWVAKCKDNNPNPCVEKFPLSKTALVAFTDAYHLTNEITQDFLIVGCILIAIALFRLRWDGKTDTYTSTGGVNLRLIKQKSK